MAIVPVLLLVPKASSRMTLPPEGGAVQAGKERLVASFLAV